MVAPTAETPPLIPSSLTSATMSATRVIVRTHHSLLALSTIWVIQREGEWLDESRMMMLPLRLELATQSSIVSKYMTSAYSKWLRMVSRASGALCLSTSSSPVRLQTASRSCSHSLQGTPASSSPSMLRMKTWLSSRQTLDTQSMEQSCPYHF
jgi:ADP-ribosylglycohydrolase